MVFVQRKTLLLSLVVFVTIGTAVSSLSIPSGKSLKSSGILRTSGPLHADASAGAIEPRGGGESGGTATIPNEVFNLIKSIAGAGVLSLPAGMKKKSVVCFVLVLMR